MNTKSDLIALHGWAMGPAVFTSTQVNWADQFNLYSPALPGYPSSPWSHDEPLPRQIDQLAADLPSGHLLGWSLGGIYALYLYKRYPQKFSGLTLVCFNPCFVCRDDWACAVKGEVFEQFGCDLERGWEATVRRFLALQLLGQPASRALARQLVDVLARHGAPEPAVLRNGLGLLKHSDCRKLLFELTRPVQMIFAENDSLVPATCGQQISQIAPGIQVECVAGAAHLPFLSHAEQFAGVLAAATKRQPVA